METVAHQDDESGPVNMKIDQRDEELGSMFKTANPGKGQQRRRFCGGRLSKFWFICVVVLAVNLVLFLALGLLTYFVIAPAIIKQKFATAQIGGGKNVVSVQNVDVKSFSDTGLSLAIASGISGTKLPISFLSGGIEPTTFFVANAANQNILSLALSNPITLDGKSDLLLTQDALGINFDSPDTARDIVSRVLTAAQTSSNQSLPLDVVITARASFTLVGITIRNVDLKRSQTIDLLSVAQMVRAVLNPMGSSGNTTSPVSASVTRDPTPSSITVSANLAKREAVNTTMSATITLGKLNVTVDDNLISAAVEGSFVMSQPITVALGPLSFTMVLASQDLANVTISGLSLSKAANSFAINVDVAPMVARDPAALAQVAETLIQGGSADGISVGVRNFTISDVDGHAIPWLQTILSGVSIDGDLGALQKDLLSAPGAASSSSALSKIVNFQGLDVQLGANSTVAINPSVKITSPIDAQISVAAISGTVTANKGTQIITFQLPAFQISGTTEQSLNFPVNITLGSTPDAQSAVSSVANALLGGQSTTLQLGGLQVGAKSASLNNLLSIINIAVPVDGAKFVGTSKAAGVSARDTTTGIVSNFDLRNATFALTDAGFNLDLDALFTQSLPVHVKIPFFELRMGVDTSNLVGLTVEGLGISQGAQSLALAARATVATDPSVGSKLSTILSTITSGNGGSSSLVLQGLQFGSSAASAFQLFNAMNATIPTSLLTSLAASSPSLLGAVGTSGIASTFSNPSITVANISAIADGLSIGAGTAVNVSLPVSVSAPFLGFDVLNENNRIVSVSVGGVAFAPGQNQLSLALDTKFANGTSAQDSASSLANALFNGSLANAQIAVSGFRFGITEAKAIGTFSSLKITVPASLLTSTGASASGLKLFPNAPTVSTSTLNPQIRSLKIAASRGGLDVAPSVSVTNPLPVSVSIPFVAITVKVNNQQLTSSTLSGLTFGSGRNALDLTLANSFGADASLPDSIKQLFDDVSAGRTPSASVSVTGLTFGTGAGAIVSTLSGIDFKVPSSLLTLGSGNPASGGLSLATLFPNATISLDTVNPLVKNVNVTALANGLSIATSAAFTNPLPVSVSIPFIGFATALNDTQFINSKLQGFNFVTGASTINADLVSLFGTDAALPTNVKTLVDGVLAGQLSGLGVSLSGLQFGIDEQSSSGILSKIVAALPLDSIVAANKTAGPSIATRLFPALGNLTFASFAPVLRKADVASTSLGFTLAVDAGLTNPVPINVNLGHFSTDVSLPSAKFVGVAVSNFAVGSGQTTLTPTVNLAFGRDPGLSADINNILSAARAGVSAQVTVGNVSFGSDAQNAVTAFSLVTVPLGIPLQGPSTLNGAGNATATSLPISLGEIKSASFATTDVGVQLGVSANVVNASPLAVKLGFISVGLSAQSGAKLAQFSLSNFTLGAGSSLLGLQLDAVLESGSGASQGVAGIFNSVMQSQSSAVRISNILFGNSEATAFNLLKSVDQSVPLSAGIIGGSTGTTTNTFSVLPAISLINTDFATTADGISATLNAGIGPTSFPISIDLGFASAGLLLDSTKLASFSTTGVGVAGGNNLVLPVALGMLPMDAALPGLIGSIVNPLLAGGAPKPFAAGANQILFGSSQGKTFDILSAINFSMPISASLIASVLNGTTAGGIAGGFALPTLVNPQVATTTSGFAAALQANFAKALPLTANIGFANASISLDDTLITNLGVGKTALDKTGVLTSSADVKFESGDAAQTKVAAIANPIIARLLGNATSVAAAGNIKISGLTFGAEGAANPLLSQIVLSIPAAKIAALTSTITPAGPAAGSTATAGSSLPLNASVALALVPSGVAGSVSIPPILAMPLTLDVGNLNASISSSGATFSQVGVTAIRLLPGAAGTIALDLQFAVSPNVYPGLVTDFLAAKPVTVNIGAITFGQPGSPLSLFSKIIAPVTVTKGALTPPKLGLVPPSATFAFTSTLPLSFDGGTLAVDAMLGKSRAATLSVGNLAIKKGGNSIKAGISLSLLGGITGLPQLLLGAGASGANLKVASSGGQDITWITQSFVGKQIPLDLEALLGSGKKSPQAGLVAEVGPQTAVDHLLANFDWSDDTQAALASGTIA
ncbi:hypothetical protein HKX48_005142 [Thoreauomyces humboldtii]|nr:hypothetical protein HKX48_005142 [Thoreauomyces humboldtii]